MKRNNNKSRMIVVCCSQKYNIKGTVGATRQNYSYAITNHNKNNKNNKMNIVNIYNIYKRYIANKRLYRNLSYFIVSSLFKLKSLSPSPPHLSMLMRCWMRQEELQIDGRELKKWQLSVRAHLGTNIVIRGEGGVEAMSRLRCGAGGEEK